MMAVTTVATGADQVWGGFAGLPAYTGRGIGVAIIDSGIAAHQLAAGQRRGGVRLHQRQAGR